MIECIIMDETYCETCDCGAYQDQQCRRPGCKHCDLPHEPLEVQAVFVAEGMCAITCGECSVVGYALRVVKGAKVVYTCTSCGHKVGIQWE